MTVASLRCAWPRRRLLAALGALGAGVLAGACSPIALLNGAAPDHTYRRTAGLAYGEFARQRLDVYMPSHGQAGAPLVVFFYGGAWRDGARGDYLFVGEALAASGCVAVIADYRLYPEVRFPAFVDDAALAVRWARDHAAEHGADPRRLVLMGHSAGAHIALLLATDPHYLAAAGISVRELAGVIGLAGPYDFLPFRSDSVREVFGPPETWAQTQPINFVRGNEPPLLLAAGDADTLVSPGNTQRLAARVRALGGVVTEIHYAGVDHYKILAALAAPLRGSYRVLDDLRGFIAAHHTGQARWA